MTVRFSAAIIQPRRFGSLFCRKYCCIVVSKVFSISKVVVPTVSIRRGQHIIIILRTSGDPNDNNTIPDGSLSLEISIWIY